MLRGFHGQSWQKCCQVTGNQYTRKKVDQSSFQWFSKLHNIAWVSQTVDFVRHVEQYWWSNASPRCGQVFALIALEELSIQPMHKIRSGKNEVVMNLLQDWTENRCLCGEEDLVKQSPHLLGAEWATGCSPRTASAGRSGKSAGRCAWSRNWRLTRGETPTLTWTCGWCERLITWATVRVRVTMYRQKNKTVRLCPVIVEICGSCHVVIGVHIVQNRHAIMDNCEHVVIGVRVMQSPRIHGQFKILYFSSQFHLGPNFNLYLVPSSILVHAVGFDRPFFL